MKNYRIAVLKGDYIGPEIMQAGLDVLKAVSKQNEFHYQIEELPFGGNAIDSTGSSLPEETIAKAQQSDAILLSAIGGPKWDDCKDRPESGLLAIRKKLNLFANIRPTEISKAMVAYSPLKNIQPIDFIIVRELTSGIYFGQPRQMSDEMALDTMRYAKEEIRRVAEVAFKMASKRKKHVTLVDKANVLATSKFWRKIVGQVANDFPDVKYDTSYVDATAMKLIAQPQQFDVILTENLFGDILSDEAAQITGSLGTIPSMSAGSNGPILYEPIHGSAPDIAGQGIADPISVVNSVAMMFEHSFDRTDIADQIKEAVDQAITEKIVTPDLGGISTTKQVTSKIIQTIQERSESDVTNDVR